jgi:hypothetical protein
LPRPALTLPSGKYEVRVQNSVLGTFKKNIILRPGGSTELPITREEFAP